MRPLLSPLQHEVLRPFAFIRRLFTSSNIRTRQWQGNPLQGESCILGDASGWLVVRMTPADSEIVVAARRPTDLFKDGKTMKIEQQLRCSSYPPHYAANVLEFRRHVTVGTTS